MAMEFPTIEKVNFGKILRSMRIPTLMVILRIMRAILYPEDLPYCAELSDSAFATCRLQEILGHPKWVAMSATGIEAESSGELRRG
jgi:hypothetical protein